MRLRAASRLSGTLFLLLCHTLRVSSQTTTSGALAGVVTDRSAAVVTGAQVEIEELSKSTTQTTTTDGDGVYQFFFLMPGKYLLKVSHPGFQEAKRNANVLLGPPVTVNVTLDIAESKTTLQVTDTAPLVQAENGDVSATMNQSQVSELPNPGNDLTYIVQTAPGVVMNTDVQGGANFSILGMPGFSYLHTMDGMNDNDTGFNLSMVGPLILLLGQNQVQETSVVTTGYSGQFGGAAGGNINYITKSGGNELHGNAQYYWNGRVLNANSWFNNAFNEPRPFSIANQWAGAVGGPLKKNKLFFFFDTEGLRLLIPQQYFVKIPSPEFEAATLANLESKFGPSSASTAFYKNIFDLYNRAPGVSRAEPGGFDQEHDRLGCTDGFVGPDGIGIDVPCARHFISDRGRPSQDTLTSGRLDWNINLSDRAFVRAQYDHGRTAWSTDPINSSFDVDFANSWWQAQTIETHTFGSSAANQFLLAGSYYEPVFGAHNLSQSLSILPATLGFGQGQFNSLGTGANFYGFIGQYQLADDFSKTARRHKIGLGGNLFRIHSNRSPNLAGTVGQLNVQTLEAFYQGGVDTTSSDTDFTSLSQSFNTESRLRVSFLNFAIYGEDDWRVRTNLTLGFTLRLEHYSNPTCETQCFARLAEPFSSQSHDPNQPYNQAILTNQRKAFTSAENILWSPRFHFAWQPLARNVVIRGGFGIFYDPLPGLILDSFSNNPPLYNSYTVFRNNLAPGEVTNLFKDSAAANAAFVNGFASGQTLAEIQAADSNFFPPAISVGEGRIDSPQYQRWSFEIQQALRADTTFNVGYYGHHGIHELTLNPSANAFGFGSLPSKLCTSPPVPPCADARFGGVTRITSNAVSNYNGMVMSFRHRFSRWNSGLFQANYTYGHALDESSGLYTFTSTALPSPQDPNNLRGSYGSADHDVRHSFNANYVWDVPVKAALGGHGWDALVSGWQISGTVFARTGFPYTVFDFEQSGNLQVNNYFGLLYAVPTAHFSSSLPCGKGAAVPRVTRPCQPPQLSDETTPNPNARFIQANCITEFNTGHLPAQTGPCDGPTVSFAQGRNRFRGPGYFNTDFSVSKSMKIPGLESGILRIGLQFYNLFNHPNFGFPDPGLSSSTFGEILSLEQPPTSVLGSGLGANASARMIQVKAELKF